MPIPAVVVPSPINRNSLLWLQKQATGKSGNVVLSAASFHAALGLVQLGAQGQTAQELQAGLGTSALAWQGSPSPYLKAANTAFAVKDFKAEGAWVAALKAKAGAVLQRGRLAGKEGARKVNAWVKAQTDGRIPVLIDTLPDDTRFVLASALFFKAPWAKPFDGKFTQSQPFEGSKDVMMMLGLDVRATHSQQAGADWLGLPFKGDRYQLKLALPQGELHGWLAGLSAEQWQQGLSDQRFSKGTLRLPRFKLDGRLDATDLLRKTGFAHTFGASPDLSGISPEKLQLSQVLQRVTFSIDETGGEAAAATVITALRSIAVQPSFNLTFNKPFVAVLWDTETQSALVTAVVRQP